MKQQKYYIFLQKQILLMIGLSLIPGFVYVMFGWIFNIALPAVLWYVFLIVTSLYGWFLYKDFAMHYMNEEELRRWYTKLTWFMYVIFSSWTVIFILYVGHTENNLHYIAIFTQLGAAVVASTLLVSDKKLFVPILLMLMLPLSLYFLLIDVWYGYILSLFSIIFLSVLLYAAYNTNRLLLENYFHAQHDVLTGLYNRRYFMDYIESVQKRVNETSGTAYMFLIDLDHFKTINDSLGHELGDKVLKEVAKRIRNYCESTHTIARLGGDEFAIISDKFYEDGNCQENAYTFSEELLQILKETYVIDRHHLYISASIGVNSIGNASTEARQFIKEADIAMYQAKEQGRDGIILFNDELAKQVAYHLEIERRLYFALEHNEIELRYQPQLDRAQKIIGCEVLVRWNSPEFGFVPPDEFISIAEKTGLIIELGNHIIAEAFKTLQSWDKKGLDLKQFSINISVRQFLHSTFLDEVKQLSDKYLNEETRKKIIFEVTETILIEDMYRIIVVINKLKHLDFSFSMDDFGTGYSSLSYLKELPVDVIKIDQSFVRNMSEDDAMIVDAVVAIGQKFDLEIVAEGVENKRILNHLKNIKCNTYQGYLAHKPMEMKNLKELL